MVKLFFHNKIKYLISIAVMLSISAKSDTNYSKLIFKENIAYVKGEKFSGTYLKFSKKMILIETGNYKDGILNGLCKRFYENGSIKSETFYSMGVIDEVQNLYYLNGKPKSVLEYFKGKLVHRTDWDENGKVIKE